MGPSPALLGNSRVRGRQVRQYRRKVSSSRAEQQRVAILAAFALAPLEAHPIRRGLDVRQLQGADFGDAQADAHRKVHRPWGWYDSVDGGERIQVERIVVRPGASLSLQMHHHRAEHWVVVRGTARVTRGEETFLVAENESTYIPIGMKHRLEIPGKVPLEIIEVQSGAYLGEDDMCASRTFGGA